MREVRGNIWDHLNKTNIVICITTNGFVKKNGECVMGKGNALEPTKVYPNVRKILGELITSNGNIVQPIINNLIAFPVKHNWYEDADIELIIKSANSLKEIAEKNKEIFFLLPYPGCGNGNLEWDFVKSKIDSILPDNVLAITW